MYATEILTKLPKPHDRDQNPPQSYTAGPRQVQASHHHSSVPNTGRNSGGRQIKKTRGGRSDHIISDDITKKKSYNCCKPPLKEKLGLCDLIHEPPLFSPRKFDFKEKLTHIFGMAVMPFPCNGSLVVQGNLPWVFSVFTFNYDPFSYPFF